MDFWDQQALMESSSLRHDIIYSIDEIQHRISYYVYNISSKEKAPIRYTKPSAIEIFKQLTANKSANPKLFSIEEISEKLTNTAEINLYRRISDFISDFNNHNIYLYIQGSDGDYTIKANNEFYKLFSKTIKNKSSIDFFEEEAIRLNEGLIKYLKDKKQAKEAIKNNKQNIIKSISKALKDLEKYFSPKLSIEVRSAENVYSGMFKNAKLDTQCGSISFTKSGVSKAEISRQISAFKQYCKQNKFNYKFKFIDSNTFSMYNTGDGYMIIFLILDNALIK